MNLQVNLRVAKIPWIGWIAVHYWFVIQEEQESQRWEIWQTQNVGQKSWGHLHFNLMASDRGVGNGDSWLEQQWEGEEAKRLAEIIRKTPSGPNSNTYVQWILNQASIDYRLNRRGLGKYYPQYQTWGTKLQI